jgi:hypothetical protein
MPFVGAPAGAAPLSPPRVRQPQNLDQQTERLDPFMRRPQGGDLSQLFVDAPCLDQHRRSVGRPEPGPPDALRGVFTCGTGLDAETAEHPQHSTLFVLGQALEPFEPPGRRAQALGELVEHHSALVHLSPPSRSYVKSYTSKSATGR